jgi:hypothetical protein
MRRILTATLVMLQMHHHGLASTPSHMNTQNASRVSNLKTMQHTPGHS